MTVETQEEKLSGETEATPTELEPFEQSLEGQPTGAIAITTILLVTILAFWFGVYLLDWLRSS